MNLKLILLTMTGLVLLPSSAVNAVEGYTSVKALLGSKSLDSDWGRNDSMATIGFQATYQPASLPFGIALDFYGSGNEDEVGSNKTETTVGEVNLGLRYSPIILAGAFSPYLGGGVSYVAAELEEVSSGVKRKYDDTGLGYWVGGGIEYLFAEHWSIGADVHYSSVDVELNKEKRDAGGVSWGATIGYRFQSRLWGIGMRNLPEDSFGLYKIYVEEELFPNWQQTFSEVSLRKVAGGTCIEVYCRDMSELHGVIHLIFNMGLNLQATKIHGFSWRIQILKLRRWLYPSVAFLSQEFTELIKKPLSKLSCHLVV